MGAYILTITLCTIVAASNRMDKTFILGSLTGFYGTEMSWKGDVFREHICGVFDYLEIASALELPNAH